MAAPGYTLLEAAAVAFIMAVVGTMVLANYSKGRDLASLRRANAELNGVLRQAQNSALSATVVNGAPAPRYGVRLTSNSFLPNDFTLPTYADIDNNSYYSPPASGTDVEIISPTPSHAPIPMTVQARCPSGFQASVQTLDVTFVPPHPTVTIRRGSGELCTRVCLFLTLRGQQWMTTVDSASGLIQNQLGSGLSCP